MVIGSLLVIHPTKVSIITQISTPNENWKGNQALTKLKILSIANCLEVSSWLMKSSCVRCTADESLQSSSERRDAKCSRFNNSRNGDISDSLLYFEFNLGRRSCLHDGSDLLLDAWFDRYCSALVDWRATPRMFQLPIIVGHRPTASAQEVREPCAEDSRV